MFHIYTRFLWALLLLQTFSNASPTKRPLPDVKNDDLVNTDLFKPFNCPFYSTKLTYFIILATGRETPK